jgi:hypothetical protein
MRKGYTASALLVVVGFAAIFAATALNPGCFFFILDPLVWHLVHLFQYRRMLRIRNRS